MSRVSTLLDRALRRPRLPFPTRQPVVAADGARVCFHIEADQGRLSALEYRCTTCATLVAACEAIVEAGPATAEEALTLSADDLLARVGGVPAERHGRFHLAVDALRAAILDGRRAR